ncbi:MAG: hypothetical protein K5829_05605 [Treponema sp.]|nr:hypothetical protein [Treponema sp.]
MKKLLLSLLFIALTSVFTFAQDMNATAGLIVPDDRIRSSEEGFAAEEFRRGVQAYYKGAFNEAIVQFEKALSYLPSDNLILEWLGKAYYKSGLEGSALSYWQAASDNGYGGLLLQNKIEIVRERRVTGDSSAKLMRLSEAGSFYGENNGIQIFNGPTSIETNSNGSIWVTAYSSNELLHINQNGMVIDRITGPLNGFDRPIDVIKLKDGKLLVSESAGNRLALLSKYGLFEKYIGERGTGLGQLVGPQYMAQDSLERIYVSDFGNRRVDVFDKDGNALFFFGQKQSGFSGLKGPTGIVVSEDSVFVADSINGCIYEFDFAGNFIRELVEAGTFKRPEALKLWDDVLVLCDQNRILSVDKNSGALFEYARTGNSPSRVMAATPDVNGNVIAADFTANEIYIMSRVQELVGGFFVQIEEIDSSAFPEVKLEVKVENRHRQPVVGLASENFYLSENKRQISNLNYLGSASNNTEADITIVIDCSKSNMLYKAEIEKAVKEIAESMSPASVLRVVSAGDIPITEYVGNAYGVKDFSFGALKASSSEQAPLDLALRLAGNDLINAAKKRAVILISDGKAGEGAFAKYTLAEIASYLNNNSIDFSMIQLTQNAVSAEYDYLIKNTPGSLYYIYRPEGLAFVVNDIIELPKGIYQLSYTSTMTTNFGEKYLPVEVEVYLLNRSGRDETGYFAPLQ